MTGKEFKEYINALNNKMRAQNRKILLFVDNAPGHPKIEVSNVKIRFLPPNATSRLQPLDAGIIKQVKSPYKKALVRYIAARIGECNTAYELLKTIDIHDAFQWVHTAWMQVSSETIKKCWNKCGFNLDNTDEGDVQEIPEPPEFQALQINGTWEEMIVMDADTETCGPSIQETESETVKEEEAEIECQDSDNEDHKPLATLQNMREKLILLKDYRAIACKLSNTKMLDLVKQVKTTMEEEIMLKINRSSKQTSIKDYFAKQ